MAGGQQNGSQTALGTFFHILGLDKAGEVEMASSDALKPICVRIPSFAIPSMKGIPRENRKEIRSIEVCVREPLDGATRNGTNQHDG